MYQKTSLTNSCSRQSFAKGSYSYLEQKVQWKLVAGAWQVITDFMITEWCNFDGITLFSYGMKEVHIHELFHEGGPHYIETSQ